MKLEKGKTVLYKYVNNQWCNNAGVSKIRKVLKNTEEEKLKNITSRETQSQEKICLLLLLWSSSLCHVDVIHEKQIPYPSCL